MKDCFVLRFNLENMTNPDTPDRVGALAAMFGLDKEELYESVDYYQECLAKLADSIDGDWVKALREKFSTKKIAFFGDSLTSDRLSYANIIKQLNVFQEVDIYAVSGSVSSQMIRSFAQRLQSKEYAFVSVFIGTNDSALTDVDLPFVSPVEYERNLCYAAKVIGGMGMQGLYMKLPNQNGKTFSNGEVISKYYNEKIERIAQANGFKLIDSNNVALNYLEDNVHFTAETQRDIAEYFLRLL